jgi:hypothetical protein
VVVKSRKRVFAAAEAMVCESFVVGAGVGSTIFLDVLFRIGSGTCKIDVVADTAKCEDDKRDRKLKSWVDK